ncbi:uncharacterized protein FA14DRAFT_135279 [Meira miltonrushii]|uniref:Uncharacterized protein n=1 Tax=Meira miltonrushii TaxID=1280837 RepID=A0A316VCA9_9BASI|nr:uncharacterized protein FA14DRAFT_135279 [Meira miltonrushii]PWN33185.1 hypothetical protein FA14DRAFT_135279 [Meira miltonrushii]
MTAQSNEIDQHSSEGESGATSSSLTAQDENVGVSGGVNTTMEKEERGLKNSNDTQNEARSSLTSLLHHESDKHTEHEKQPSNQSNMSRTINTVPVWARQQQKEKNAIHFRKEGESSQSSPKINSIGGSPLKKPAPLHLNTSNQTRTALATQEASNRQRSSINPNPDQISDNRFSIDTSSIITVDDDNPGASRFASLSYRHVGPKTRVKIPFNKEEAGNDDTEKSSSKRSTSKQTPVSGGFSSAITGILAGLTSSEAQRSNDSTQDTDAQNRSQSYNYDEEEKHMSGVHEGTRGGWSHDETHDETHAQENRAKMLNDDSFTRHQPVTPGWASPWRPESRGEHSIRIGKYRFNNHGEGGYFPKTDTGATNSSRKRRRRRHASSGAVDLFDVEWWRRFLLHNPFVPLLFRLVNIAFTSSTLAVAAKLYIILKREGAEDSVGSSPIVAIIFAPLTLVHVGVQIYVEYFSKPIGLWRVGSKLFYTLTELIFVCLWSAALSLSFDNYFTSTLVCSTLNSPYSGGHDRPVFGQQVLNNPSRKPYICRLQGALIGLVFTSLLAYVVVFSVSLFRIFVRVSKR